MKDTLRPEKHELSAVEKNFFLKTSSDSTFFLSLSPQELWIIQNFLLIQILKISCENMFIGVNFLTSETEPENPASVESYADEISEFKHCGS